MACKHCGTKVEFLPADHGRQFLCTGCGKPGVYGFGAESPVAGVGGQSVPAPMKPKSGGGVLTWVGGGVIGIAAIFGLVGKGAKHAGKAAKAIPTRTIPAQLPSRFTAPAFRTGSSASPGFAPSASGASNGMMFLPFSAGFHASRALPRESGEKTESWRIATEEEAEAAARDGNPQLLFERNMVKAAEEMAQKMDEGATMEVAGETFRVVMNDDGTRSLVPALEDQGTEDAAEASTETQSLESPAEGADAPVAPESADVADEATSAP
ncbi:MAG TPA: hypothetical protein VGN57_08335 [Pirellulaceae bacterium]|nr:hypothetical protein [Pirellulaceae bacterium]